MSTYFAVLAAVWMIAAGAGRAVVIILSLPALWFVAYQLYGLVLLLVASSRWQSTGLSGVLVYSDSPNWRDYIDERWLPQIGSRLQILNWSDRRNWRKTLEVRLFHRFVGASNNFNPSVVVLRGLKHPLVFRCFFRFQRLETRQPNRSS